VTGPLSAETRTKLAAVSTATLTSQLLGRGFRSTFLTGVAPLRPDLAFVGTAFTLRYVPAREDVGISSHFDNETNVQRLAVESVGPGDVLVVDARGQTGAASLGHILATRLLRRGAAGIVTDGALRDTPRFRELNLPVYCRAAHASVSSILHHPVEMNVPIGCADVLVMPGDVLVGDAEGVVVVPRMLADEVAEEALQQERLEEFVLAKIDAGAPLVGTYPPDEQTRLEFRTTQ
jgi:regulator of RNase E activity RraA